MDEKYGAEVEEDLNFSIHDNDMGQLNIKLDSILSDISLNKDTREFKSESAQPGDSELLSDDDTEK